jgi:hypothetical protein
MSRKPLLLVDIDGVVSLFGFAPDDHPAGTWANVDGILHLLSTVAAEHLLDLESQFELHWCSGWEEKANEHLPHLAGLGPFPYVELDRARAAGSSTPGHWKLDGIERHIDANRAIAWVDDELNEACGRWAADRPGPTLLVATVPAVGLDDDAASRLRAWAAAQASS